MIHLDGHLPDWSPHHDAHDPDYLDGEIDGAVRPFLDRLAAVGLYPASSCQGGWVFRTSDQVEFQTWMSNGRGRRVRDPNPRWTALPGPEENWTLGTLVPGGGSWWKKRPHLFLATGPGHGRSGVARGPGEMIRVLDADLVRRTETLCAAFTRVPDCSARIAADETSTLILLDGTTPMDDTAAHAWWEAVTAAAEKQRESVALP